jgi:hypothetical protein
VKPLQISEIQLDKIIYENIRGVDKRYVLIHYEKPGNKLLFQTPQLLCTTLPIKNNGYYDFDIPLYGRCMRKVNKFIKLLRDLDNKCINDVKKYAKFWFKGKSNIRYKSLIREVPETNRVYENGVIKVKLLDGFDKTTITQNNREVTYNDLVQNNHIRMILEVCALLITDDGFSLYLKPHLVDQQVIKKYQFSFVDDSDSDSILYTEMGKDENVDIDIDPNELFIKDSESTVMHIEKKPIEKRLMSIPETENVNNNDELSSDNIPETLDTNDESMYETSTMVCDYNNMVKKK